MVVRNLLRAALAAGLLLTVGCSKGPSVPTVPVSGTVKYNGEPLAQAEVAFISKVPTGQQHPAHGKTDDQGQFKLSTYINPNDLPGAVPGEYVVTISKVENTEVNTEDFMKQQMSNRPQEAGANMQEAMKSYSPPQPKSLIPVKYGDPLQSKLEATVKSDGSPQTFTFELTDSDAP